MSNEPTGFLYPFLAAEERNGSTLLADLARSAAAKIDESEALRARSIHDNAQTIERAATEMAGRFRNGARLLRLRQRGERHRRAKGRSSCSVRRRTGAPSRRCPWWTTAPF